MSGLSAVGEVTQREAAEQAPANTAVARRTLRPDEAGWAQAAMAIRAVRQIQQSVALRLHVTGVGTVTIDSATHAYWGDIMPDTFPLQPAAVLVETWPAEPSSASENHAVSDLDGLLWRIGFHGFDDAPASWLAPRARFRLLRWPNIGALDVGADELRLIALLANASFSTDELADSLGMERGAAQRVINALSLIGILSVETADDRAESAAARDGIAERTRDDVVATEPAVTAPVRSTNIFSRLRKRLGF